MPANPMIVAGIENPEVKPVVIDTSATLLSHIRLIKPTNTPVMSFTLTI